MVDSSPKPVYSDYFILIFLARKSNDRDPFESVNAMICEVLLNMTRFFVAF